MESRTGAEPIAEWLMFDGSNVFPVEDVCNDLQQQ